MYAAPSKAPAATRKTRDANYPQAPKTPTKLVQYKRDKYTVPAAVGSAATQFVAGDPQATYTAAEDPASELDPQAGTYAAPSAQLGVWGSQRLAGLAHSAGAAEGGPALADDAVAEAAGTANAPTAAGAVAAMAGSPGEHPLRFAWSFWFMHRAPGHKINDYEAAMTKIATFGSVESFWVVYSHLKRADQVPTITDYHMFRAGVRPVWEDPENINGGKWMIRVKKGLASRLWEKLAMAAVGNVFGVDDEICGIVLSIRNSEDIISLWNKTALDTKSTLHIRDTMKLIMGLPADCAIEYKAHNDSLRDNSNFRNADVYK
ncbi:hypothetical protein LPJ61_001434 [Coemansia biformis]|uniref:IF4E-domain-containing protein n=1 Tax=Coemansia biformis TaxID=1286918 RepID=A0A9W7YEC3_9FUNG|nr:hypothetical protein LPJ61_001434 [Coemansia biformis]